MSEVGGLGNVYLRVGSDEDGDYIEFRDKDNNFTLGIHPQGNEPSWFFAERNGGCDYGDLPERVLSIFQKGKGA